MDERGRRREERLRQRRAGGCASGGCSTVSNLPGSS